MVKGEFIAHKVDAWIRNDLSWHWHYDAVCKAAASDTDTSDSETFYASATLLLTQLSANAPKESSKIWLKYLDPCYPYRRLR